MGRVWALAILTLKAALRSNVVVFAIAAYAVILLATALLAPAPEKEFGEEATAGAFDAERSVVTAEAQRIRFVQSTSLGAAFFLAVIIVAIIGGVWLPRQIKEKYLTTVMSKPAGAWRVVAGSWLGFGLLTAVLFVAFAAMSIVCCRAMAALSDNPEEAAEQLKTLRTAYATKLGRVNIDAVKDGSLPPESVQWLVSEDRTVLSSTKQAALWLFGKDADEDEARCRAVFEIQKQTNPFAITTDLEIRLWYSDTGALGPPLEAKRVSGEKLVEFSVEKAPGGDAARPGENSAPATGVLITPLEAGYDVVCYQKGLLRITDTAPFEADYVKTFAMSGLAVLVFIAITVGASTFLSPNVSMFFSASIGVMGGIVSFIREFLGEKGFGAAKALGAEAPTSALLDPAAGGWEAWARTIGHSLLVTAGDGMELLFRYVLPDWTKFDAGRDILSRLHVSLGEYWTAFLYCGIYCVFCVLAGGAILHRREVGKG